MRGPPVTASKGRSKINEVSRVATRLGCWTGDWQGFRISSKGCQCGSSSSTVLGMPGFCHHFLVEFLHTNSHENTMRKTMKIFTYIDPMSQGVPKSVKKKVGIAWWASNIAVGSSSGKAKGPWRKNPFSRSNHADVHTPLLHNFVRYETLGKLKLTLCDINSIDWVFWDKWHVLGACRHLHSDLDSSRGRWCPTIFVIINGGNFKCEVNPLKAPWQIRSLFWALLEICRQLNVKVSRHLEIMPQYMTQSSWVHFLCFY